MKERYVTKSVLIGDKNKTEVRRKYFGNKFLYDHLSTLGVDFSVKTVEITEKYLIEHQIWDLSEGDNFKLLRKRFYRGLSTIILVLDIKDIDNYDMNNFWFEEIYDVIDGKPINFILMITDTGKSKVFFSKLESNEFLNYLSEFNLNIVYFEYFHTSIETGQNINKSFFQLSKYLFKNQLLYH